MKADGYLCLLRDNLLLFDRRFGSKLASGWLERSLMWRVSCWNEWMHRGAPELQAPDKPGTRFSWRRTFQFSLVISKLKVMTAMCLDPDAEEWSMASGRVQCWYRNCSWMRDHDIKCGIQVTLPRQLSNSQVKAATSISPDFVHHLQLRSGRGNFAHLNEFRPFPVVLFKTESRTSSWCDPIPPWTLASCAKNWKENRQESETQACQQTMCLKSCVSKKNKQRKLDKSTLDQKNRGFFCFHSVPVNLRCDFCLLVHLFSEQLKITHRASSAQNFALTLEIESQLHTLRRFPISHNYQFIKGAFVSTPERSFPKGEVPCAKPARRAERQMSNL